VTSPEKSATAAVLADVNAATGSRWRVKGRLAGGVLGGAWRVRDETTVAVLKCHDPSSAAPRNVDAPAVVEYIRAHGYPTPAWIAAGTTATGITYSVQEFIPGKPIPRLDIPAAELIIMLVQVQRALSPPTSMSWSAFMRDHSFGHDESHDRVAASSSPAASALASARALAAPHETSELPDDEMVHCDLSVSNILMHEGQLSGVVDIDATGRGCAAYDALTAALNGTVWPSDPDAVDRLNRFAIDEYGPAPAAIAAATLVIEALDWAATSYPDRVDITAARSEAWMADLRRLL
jgi:aminoglycoside phosphotransferase (APT) family kinase protein